MLYGTCLPLEGGGAERSEAVGVRTGYPLSHRLRRCQLPPKGGAEWEFLHLPLGHSLHHIDVALALLVQSDVQAASGGGPAVLIQIEADLGALDVADVEQLLRIVQSVPSPKAEPFKMWLAQVGRENTDKMSNTLK